MKTINRFLLVLAIPALGISCSQHSENARDHSGAEPAGEHQHQEATLSLNNGKAWPANPETTTGIGNMLSHVEAFSGEEKADYEALKENLETELNLIIKKCTMKGEAHDQLHHYLMPMKDLFNGLASSDPDERKESLDQLHDHLGKYFTYFE